MAELARRKDGRWPDAMDDLPEDPFSHKPLKYAVGKYEMPEDHFQPNDNPEPFGISSEEQKQLRLTDEQAAEFTRPRKYTFKSERRTIDAVQIWSVGPNGVDDGGERLLNGKDDIRFIIPIK